MEEVQSDRFLVALFDGTNYAAWKFRVQVLLEEHELWDCVQTELGDLVELAERDNDTAAQRTEKNALREKRKKRERKCKSMLISRIHDSQLEYVQDKATPKQVWDALKRVFERKSIASRMHLKRQMLSMRFDGGRLQDHFLRFDKLLREYRGTGAAMEDLDAVCHLLLTLGPAYSTVVTALETMPEENLTMEFVKCRLLDEETKQKSVDSEKFPSNSDTAAFSGTKQQKKIRCFRCKKEGHKLADCPEKKKPSEQKGHRSSKANVAESADRDRDGVCFVGVSGCGASQQARRSKWFIDSGASDHLVRDKELFTELHRLETPVEIAVAKDGESIVAEHSGTVKVMSIADGRNIECTVKNVLFIPQLRYNLFSVSRVEKAGMSVVFERGKALIYRDSEIVASGKRCDSLYELDFEPIRKSENEKALSCGQVPKDFELWHRRFGHISAKNLEVLVRNDMVSGLKVDNDKKQSGSITCEPCIAGKLARKPFSRSEERRSSRVLELVHSDVCGPVTPVGLFGSRFFVTFIDDWTHFTVVFLIESKSEVLRCFEQYEAMVTAKFGKQISRLRCDNGGEYTGKHFKKFCANKGIQMELTVAYTPEQNGVSERMNRTLVEKARAMLVDSGVSKEFWGQAVQTAAYLLNRSPTCAVQTKKTPFELWEDKKPDVSKLRVFGCSVFVHVPSQLRKKLDSKSWRGIFLGYSPNGYRVWDPVKRRIVTARDVVFVETEIGREEQPKPVAGDQLIEISSSPVPENEEEEADGGDDAESSEEEYESLSEESSGESSESGDETADGRPQRDRARPAWHRDFEFEYAGFALNAMSYVDNIPGSIAELKRRDDWDNWRSAIEEEMDSLRRNNTWTLTELPAGRKAVSCKWVFRIKRGDGDVPDRYKARLVARGFSQRQGFDYTETYSPVAKLDTLRTVLALANRDRLHVHQMDVRTAFLNGTLSEEIFMTQPDGFQQGKNLVCRLNRSIYGLKQASRAWNQRFHEFTEKLGLKQSANDQCLYTMGEGRDRIIVIVYVDDILIVGASLQTVKAIKRKFSEEFEMTDAGEVRQFLGMTIKRNVEAGTMKISQRGYLESLLRRFDMMECKSISTPMENRLRLEKGVEERRTDKPYRELVGCLMYASLTARPDLSAAVNYYSQFQACPNEEHWVHLKRVLRYVKGTLDYGLLYEAETEEKLLQVFSDADWANDLIDRRSVTGCVFKVSGCTVSWTTRKQHTVSLSSTEAELAALVTAACHTLWMKRLLLDLGHEPKGPITILEDNQSTIRIAEDARDHGRLKHVDTKYHFLRELIQQAVITVEFVCSSDQQADIMTKALPSASFKKLRSELGIGPCCG